MPRRPPAVASATGPGPLQPEGAEEEAAGFLDASALPVSEPARQRRGSSRWGKPGDRLDSAWWRLRSIAQAPRFLHQPHVLTGYRKQLTAWEAARSAFMLHNETGAIWTHLIGALVFVVLAVRVGTWGVVGDAPYFQASPELHEGDATPDLFDGDGAPELRDGDESSEVSSSPREAKLRVRASSAASSPPRCGEAQGVRV